MDIEHKLEQMYAALRELQVTEKLSSIKPKTKRVGSQFVTSIDFTKGADRATAANRVSLLLHNIACLKDHLKAWCKKNGKKFRGDDLIDQNKDIGIIHDLWNLEKHGELKRSRSGHWPTFAQPPRTSLVFKGGPEPASVTIPMFQGGVIQATGNASFRISTSVTDKSGKNLGDLENIALRAVAAWETEFAKAGMKLIPPPDRQQEYAKLSGQLQAIGLRYKSELPSGATSLLMKVGDGRATVEIYDRMGKKIDHIPNDQTSIALREALHRFQYSISPDHDGVVAII